ncbi:MAG: PTS sugar transporter subunit IIA [Treponema sp.]|nr:PTS sugar transporter subunit IIA [Treponema sp.]
MFEDEILTIEEVAQYLRVSERTVYEWAQKGEIPAGKIGTIWRFKRDEVLRWVNERISGERVRQQAEAEVQVGTMLSPGRILFFDGGHKRDVIIELAGNLATAPQIRSGEKLATEILKREELMSTAIGKGIAIPHIRLHSVTDLVVSVGISRKDIEGFQPLDDEPVRLVIMIAAAYNQHTNYLHTLSFFASKLKDGELRGSLLRAETPDQAYGILASLEG